MKETILLFHAPDKDTLLKIEMALFRCTSACAA